MSKNPKENVIGVFFGGKNTEHEVSIITGQMIISELKKIGYKVVPVYIDKKGRWFSEEEMGFLKFFTDPNFENKLNDIKTCTIGPDIASKGLVVKKKGCLSKKKIIDIAFPAFHGMNGEDGTIQSLFELYNVPYVGCGVMSSSITMDKIITKQLYYSENIPTARFIFFTEHDWKEEKRQVMESIKKLSFPVFIKPSRLGSSIGITRVHTFEEIENACDVALHYDSRVIVEEGVCNLVDITCAVLGNENPIPSLVQESVFQGDHFSYEDKYLENGGAQFGNDQESIIIPARLDEETTAKVRDLSVRIYKLFDCSGIARIDFLYDKEGKKVYANEVNTMPGTLYHHLWKASGIGIESLLEELIVFAKKRQREKNKVTSTFKSNILDYANSVKMQIGRNANDNNK